MKGLNPQWIRTRGIRRRVHQGRNTVRTRNRNQLECRAADEDRSGGQLEGDRSLRHRRIVPTLATAVAYRHGDRGLGAVLVTASGTSRHHIRSLCGHRQRGHRGQEQYHQRFGSEYIHPGCDEQIILHGRCASHSGDSRRKHTSVRINPGRDGGIGRRVGLRIQCPKGVQVQVLFPAPKPNPLKALSAAAPGIQSSSPVTPDTKRLGGVTVIQSSDLRMTRIPLNHGAGQMPAVGSGTLIPDPAVTISATRAALEAGFRHFDGAER